MSFHRGADRPPPPASDDPRVAALAAEISCRIGGADDWLLWSGGLLGDGDALTEATALVRRRWWRFNGSSRDRRGLSGRSAVVAHRKHAGLRRRIDATRAGRCSRSGAHVARPCSTTLVLERRGVVAARGASLGRHPSDGFHVRRRSRRGRRGSSVDRVVHRRGLIASARGAALAGPQAVGFCRHEGCERRAGPSMRGLAHSGRCASMEGRRVRRRPPSVLT